MQLSFGPRTRRATGFEVVGLVSLLGFAIARFVPVARLPFWGCPFRKATGWPCPGCGLTRAADHLAHGDGLGALQVHPLGALLGMLLAAVAFWTCLHLAFGVPTPHLRLSEGEGARLRGWFFALVFLNYAYILVRARFPQWIS